MFSWSSRLSAWLVMRIVPRRRIVWIVAGAACLEAISEAFSAAAEDRLTSMWIWTLSTVAIFAAGALVESLKESGGE